MPVQSPVQHDSELLLHAYETDTFLSVKLAEFCVMQLNYKIMKKKFLQYGLAMLIGIPLFTNAQVTLVKTSNSTPFSYAQICSGNASDNPNLTLTVSSLTPAPYSGVSMYFHILEINPATGAIINTQALNSANVGPFSTPLSYQLEITNTAIKSITQITPPNTVGSDNFTRRDGTFKFRGTYRGVDGLDHNFFSPQFALIEGEAPRLKIAAPNEVVTNWAVASPLSFNILSGCVNNDPRLRLPPFNCGLDDIRVIAWEDNPYTGARIGPEITRPLTPTELGNIITTTGVAINGFNDGTNTLTLTTGKHYFIALVYAGQSQWKMRAAAMSYKAGNWDLMIIDNYNDKGHEPLDVWDNNVFKSPWLWNKKSNSGSPLSEVHEPPTYASIGTNYNKMFAKVRNIGCQSSPANQQLRMYWTIARGDELYISHWEFSTANRLLINSIYQPAGSEITISGASWSVPFTNVPNPVLLPVIAAGADYTPPGVTWYPPNPQLYRDVSLGGGAINGRPSLCLLARINEKTSSGDPIVFEPNGTTDKILPYVKNNNNVATLNTVLYDEPGFFRYKPGGDYHYGTSTILVNNTDPASRPVNLCVDLLPANLTTFLNNGQVEVFINNSLYNLWTAGGSQVTNISYAGNNGFTVLVDNHFCLNNLTLPSGYAEGQFGLRFTFDHTATLPVVPEPLEYVISQQYLAGEITGSNTVVNVTVPNVANTNTSDGLAWGESGSYFKKGSTGITGEDDENALAFMIAPNPTNGKFRVLSATGQKDLKAERILIVNSIGQTIVDLNQVSLNTEFDLSNYAAGIYFVNIYHNDKIQIIKLLR